MRTPSRFRGKTLEQARKAAAAALGPDLRIISAEQVTRGGLGGFFASRYFEVVAVPGAEHPEGREHPPALAHPRGLPNLPGAPNPPGPAFPVQVPEHLPGSVRRGVLAALLDAADAGDGAAGTGAPGAGPAGMGPGMAAGPLPGLAAPPVSTVAPEFDRLLHGLDREVGRPNLPGSGQILLLAGLREDALRGARMLSRTTVLEGVFTCGVLHMENLPRWSGEAATPGAPGPLVVALGLGSRWDALARSMVGRVPADAVWAVVDAGRKPEDTRAWVEGLHGAGPVAGIVVVGEKGTATPHTPAELGLPILLAGDGDLFPDAT
ncbi:hypothetical protein NCCP1664_01650 [Zafaria cholistanensis]|uniref:Uncharacterized protein n=1 Tax=Zafaria cholistanensis TaxID=1682741 RepID=A0A5A7NPG3_9MICC|nr:hypothetical protein [Zafaria cholistanensis]GER21668.1 hypothetical protein NCCP1664_01650 [Zafaria cholistanensis]